MAKELKYTQLKNWCNENILKSIEKNFENLTEESLVGQKNALEALEFGLEIKNKGYNIYISGEMGSGRTTFAKKYSEKIAITQKTPNDILYVYNFKNPIAPILISLEAGKGKEFKNDVDDAIHLTYTELKRYFNSKEFLEEKDNIIKFYNEKKDDILDSITNLARKKGFGVKNSVSGIYFMPIIDGVTISDETFENLLEEEKEIIDKKLKKLQLKTSEIIKEVKDLDKSLKDKIKNLEFVKGIFLIGKLFQYVQDKYIYNEKITKYLIDLKENLIENIDTFIKDEDETEDETSLLPLIVNKPEEENTNKYKVNLIVDNSNLKGAPVILSYNASYCELFGDIEFENEIGNFTTDHMKIKSGIVHKANGGYLILHVDYLSRNPYSLETILKVLNTSKVKIEPSREIQIGGINVSSLEPEEIDLNIKIVLIGSSYLYDILAEYDEQFEKLFKVRAIFDYEMENNTENIEEIYKFIKTFVKNENLLNLNIKAIKYIIEYANKIAETKNKLTTKISKITEILIEANYWAKLEKDNIITEKYIKKAIEKKLQFLNIYEKKIESMIIDNDILIDTDNFKIGQINGLSVLDFVEYSIGKPTRITATSYIGKSGFVNIEKEAELSGGIHDKGLQVITGYLGQKYAFDFPLSLSCKICFEQNYSEIDGDSASLAELYTIISSISEVPINQGIAVTGSVNQFGEVQPIGGVNSKIEGFFKICKLRGLTGFQGVIIPTQNVKDLFLNDEVIEAVKEGKFHIYAISNVDEGLEILTSEKAGKKGKNNKFTLNSIHYKAMKKLSYFYKKSLE